MVPHVCSIPLTAWQRWQHAWAVAVVWLVWQPSMMSDPENAVCRWL